MFESGNMVAEEMNCLTIRQTLNDVLKVFVFDGKKSKTQTYKAFVFNDEVLQKSTTVSIKLLPNKNTYASNFYKFRISE